MKVGSIVETIADFTELSNTWGIKYPNKGDVLTVSNISEHPNKECNNKNIVLLFFEEVETPFGICDKTIDGDYNFVELTLPEDLFEVLEYDTQRNINIFH